MSKEDLALQQMIILQKEDLSREQLFVSYSFKQCAYIPSGKEPCFILQQVTISVHEALFGVILIPSRYFGDIAII